MIAITGYYKYLAGDFAPMSVSASARGFKIYVQLLVPIFAIHDPPGSLRHESVHGRLYIRGLVLGEGRGRGPGAGYRQRHGSANADAGPKTWGRDRGH